MGYLRGEVSSRSERFAHSLFREVVAMQPFPQMPTPFSGTVALRQPSMGRSLSRALSTELGRRVSVRLTPLNSHGHRTTTVEDPGDAIIRNYTPEEVGQVEGTNIGSLDWDVLCCLGAAVLVDVSGRTVIAYAVQYALEPDGHWAWCRAEWLPGHCIPEIAILLFWREHMTAFGVALNYVRGLLDLPPMTVIVKPPPPGTRLSCIYHAEHNVFHVSKSEMEVVAEPREKEGVDSILREVSIFELRTFLNRFPAF